MPERRPPLEIALSAGWHAGAFGSDFLTHEGETIQVIHRGQWSHGVGPDFRDALLLFNSRELRSGSIEIHLRSRGWFEHGHHLDEAFDDVILHVVSRHDGAGTRRNDGGAVPVVEIGPLEDLEQPDFVSWDWHRVGGKVCAERVSNSSPQALRNAIWRLGDVRIATRSAGIEARLPTNPPGEILWDHLLDGLGFSANREPMRMLARRVSIASLETLLQAIEPADRLAVTRGILLGVAGFLPLSQSESHLGGIHRDDVSHLERAWRQHGAPWHGELISPSRWNRARVRPANHPVARLLAAAAVVVNASYRGGMLPTIIELMLGDADPVDSFRALSADTQNARIGADRTLDLLASEIIPFSFALASQTSDQALTEAAARHWEALPAPAANAITRRAAQQVAGSTPLGKIGARGSQGLIHLDTVLCQPRRCFECPIAVAELAVKG